MKYQIAIWIFIMGINFSLNKDPQRHCYLAENEHASDEYIPKYRGQRSLSKYSQVIKPKQSGVCSTWGNFHFRTFDGEIYRFPGICNYLFASHCGRHYEDFNIQIQQAWNRQLPTIFQLSVKINELLIEVTDHIPTIQGKILELPYNKNGILIDKVDNMLHISAKFILELTWEGSNNIHLTLHKKYMGETCGLCGNNNGNATDDLVYNGIVIDPLLFGQLQKLRKPEEICEDPKPEPIKKCIVFRAVCLKHLQNFKWRHCNKLVNPKPYVEAYILDMCLCNATAEYRSFCLCSTKTEYSRQCALAGGRPPDWRSPNLCDKSCPANFIYKECSPPCRATCSNPGEFYFCDGPCVSGCVCPLGLVKDDITHLGCIPIKNCPCTYNDEIFAPGSVYNISCRTCLCTGGHWKCREIPCPSTCAVEGGSHVTTFDKTQYTFHGKCKYLLTKPCGNSTFSVSIMMTKCAHSESGTCLTCVSLSLDDGTYDIEIKYDNNDFPFVNFDKDKMAKAGVNVFWPSSFYLIVHTNKGLYLQVQLTPIMQLYVVLEPSYKEKMCGLCGNFNSIQKDDLRSSSGTLESNIVDFANSWKVSYKCKNIKPIHEHPCIYGMEIEKYAHYWCNVLLDTNGPFAACHSSVSPATYQQKCLFDTCSCKRAEDCLCASISSYVWACASAGVTLSGWREDICRNFKYYCPPSFVYSYTVTTCIPTCRFLSKPDPACNIKFHTVDGCVCPNGTYLNDKGFCVKREDCPCYYKGIPVSDNEPLSVGQLICTCTNGTLQCIDQGKQECPHPMVYFDCDKAGETAKGIECARTCDSSIAQCYSPLCVSGCLCPIDFVLSTNKTCIREEQCPCFHNGTYYNPGDVATVQCNQCVCRNRTWVCNGKSEKGICTVYGEGHYITFDNKRYTTNGDCEHILVQDYCDIDHLWNGTFKIISENIPCGTTGTSCSKAITVCLGSHKLILTSGGLEVLETSSDVEIPYKTRNMGSFTVIETNIGVILVWDRKTSIYIHLSTKYKGKVCGLCGNFDGNGNNDFTTRSQCVVVDVKQFRDSWKISPDCPEVYISKDPCVVNPYRIPWAQRMCNIILSHVFASCHSEIDPEDYYDACVRDTCACDMGGDCDCYCTAVSAYAQACSEVCVCIEWRSSTVCPLFCDFYNKESQCDWHYKSCGANCIKTCRNPEGTCLSNLKGLEGCYPKCPEDKPYFNEDEMQCVSQCGCLDKEENYYLIDERIESCKVCEICICTRHGIVCHYDTQACNCDYKGYLMEIGEMIEVADGLFGCKIVICGSNGITETPCYETTEGISEFSKTTPFSTLSTEKTTSIGSTKTLIGRSTITSSMTTLSSPRPSSTSLLRTTIFTSTPNPVTEYSSVTSKLTKASSISPKPSTEVGSKAVATSATTVSSSKSSTRSTYLSTMGFSTTTKTLPKISTLSASTTKSHQQEKSNTTKHLAVFSSSSPVDTELTRLTIGPETSELTVEKTSIETPKKDLRQNSTFSLHSLMTNTQEAIITEGDFPPVTTIEKSNASLVIITKKGEITLPVYSSKCHNITCNANGTLNVVEAPCPDIKIITCGDGIQPLKIYDEDGCCYHYECPHCIGPQGIIKQPGETWIDNCQVCHCDKYLANDVIKARISCNHWKCPPLDSSACNKEGLRPYFALIEEEPCCHKIECKCEPLDCNYPEPCPLGYETIPKVTEGECCITFNCRPMNVCITDGAVYQVGQKISVSQPSCKTCTCSEIKNPKTGFNDIVCEPILCMTECREGHVYDTSNNGCCGTCVQEFCIVIANDGFTYLLQPGESRILPDDNCTEYTCELRGNTFISSSQTQVCPKINEEDCISGLLKKTPDGCCSICKEPTTCRLQTHVIEISKNGCSANVSLSYCEGWCPRKFNEISLCLETDTTVMEYELICPGDIDNIKITKPSATNCACSAVNCTS
ncbi:mucin-2-like [Ranitomeya variabilis]|uniref:mucin-2-like n=1 Tax=Ranitomeya variabilis TaxID=490064 RepID=UPI00405794C3